MTNNQIQYQVPEWTKSAVWYQIFPERFRNGYTLNNPRIKDIQGTSPWGITENQPWQIHPWGSDWYELLPYEKANKKSFWTNILRRRYGGDLAGIIEKLDYLQDLGVNAIYLNPIFYAPSSHKYDATCFHHAGPTIGFDSIGDKWLIEGEIFDDAEKWIWTSADLLALRLIDEVHKRGMRIIFDGVFHHIGYNSVPFQDVLKNREQSKYKDWFLIDWKKSTPEKLVYETFWGRVKEMPRLNFNCEEVRKYIFSSVQRWMRPEVNEKVREGIDGWRLDHAIGVPVEFWVEFRSFVKSLNSEAYITGELIEETEVVAPYLQQTIFDAITNYNLLYIIAQYFIAEKNRLTTHEFHIQLEALRNLYPEPVTYAMQNLLSSHDSERIGSYIVNRRLKKYGSVEAFYSNSKADNPDYQTRKPDVKERKLQMLVTIFQFTYIGAPMIYYGDEAGMWGGTDPCCRKPMIWEDITYLPEVCKPNDWILARGYKVEFNQELFDFHKKLAHIRKSNEALQKGNFELLYLDDLHSVYAFKRTFADNTVMLFFNNSNSHHDIKLKFDNDMVLTDLLTDETFKTKKLELKLRIEARWSRILVIAG